MRDAYKVMPNAIIWETFQEQFHRKFFPDHVYQRKEEEIIALKQNQMTEAIFLHTFFQLAKFSKDLVDAEAKKIKRLVGGLHPMYEKDVVMYRRPETFDDAVDRTYTAERWLSKKGLQIQREVCFGLEKAFSRKGKEV